MTRRNPFDKYGVKNVRLHYDALGGWFFQADSLVPLQLSGGGSEKPYRPSRAATDDELLFRWWAMARKGKWRVHPKIVFEIIRPNPRQPARRKPMRPPSDLHNPRITELLGRHKFRLVWQGGDLWRYERPLPDRYTFVISTVDGTAPMTLREQTHLYLMGPQHAEPVSDRNFAGVPEILEFIQQSRYAIR